jgi:hypothetical protein
MGAGRGISGFGGEAGLFAHLEGEHHKLAMRRESITSIGNVTLDTPRTFCISLRCFGIDAGAETDAHPNRN